MRPVERWDARVIVVSRSAFDRETFADSVNKVRTAWPLVDIIIWAPRATAGFVRDAMRAGVRDVLLTESPDICAHAVANIIEAQQLLPRTTSDTASSAQRPSFEGMVARSRAMWDLFDTVIRVAPTEASVLILGETGTGKELLARAIHRRSHRTGRFVAVNCAAVPENLIDSELFGHVQGAFTGATRTKAGLFRHAEQGTLMLDEIGNIPLAGQHRLLRALQEGSVRPIGGDKEIPLDVRVIAATSSPLEEEVVQGSFREDLFYRLDVIRFEIPPLRERPDDIIFLFGHFARRLSKHYNLPMPEVTDGFLDALVEYPWPGNVRQLENVTERMVLTYPSRKVTSTQLSRLLPFRKLEASPAERSVTAYLPARVPDVDLDEPMEVALGPHREALERTYLVGCLERHEGRIGETAAHAGISRRTLLRKLKQLNIDKRDFRAQ